MSYGVLSFERQNYRLDFQKSATPQPRHSFSFSIPHQKRVSNTQMSHPICTETALSAVRPNLGKISTDQKCGSLCPLPIHCHLVLHTRERRVLAPLFLLPTPGDDSEIERSRRHGIRLISRRICFCLLFWVPWVGWFDYVALETCSQWDIADNSGFII